MKKIYLIALDEEETDALNCMIENEVNSNLDMIENTAGKEKSYWKKEVLFLTELKQKFTIANNLALESQEVKIIR